MVSRYTGFVVSVLKALPARSDDIVEQPRIMPIIVPNHVIPKKTLLHAAIPMFESYITRAPGLHPFDTT